MSIAPLIAALEQGNTALDSILAEYEGLVSQITGALTRQVNGLERVADGRLMHEISPLKARQILDDAGWSTAYSGLRSALEQSVTANAPLLEALGYGSPAPSRRAFLTAVTMGDAELDAIRSRLGQVLYSNLAQATVMPIKQSTLAFVIQEATQASVARAKSVANTAMAGFQRDIAQQAAADLPQSETLYLYIGPKDDRTRDFCKRRAGKAFRLSDLLGARNKSGLPVMRYGGGYNCRHSIIPITRAIAAQRSIPIGGAA